MARLSGNTLRTVRFYEESGLLEPAQRTEGGHRLFGQQQFDKLRLVSELRAAGLSLDAIKSMLETKQRHPTGDEAAKDVIERLDEQVAMMADRIDLLSKLKVELESARKHLAECVGCDGRKHYPNECGNCGVMADAQRVTNAVSVLWSVDRPDDDSSDGR